jgi:hypothetical protein
MNSELSYKTGICGDYEKLLWACVKSLESWKNRRESIACSHLSGKEVGDELMRLQAEYAKAYSRLEKHRNNCQVCRFVLKIAGRNDSSISTAVMDRKNSA